MLEFLLVGLCISIYLIVLSRRAQHKIKNEIDEIHRSRSGYDGGMTIQRHKSAELQKRNTADQALWKVLMGVLPQQVMLKKILTGV